MSDRNNQISESRDFVVVGGGPAGLSAALVATTNGIDTLLLEKTGKLGGQIYWMIDDPVPDFLGQPVKDGKELVARFVQHIEARGVEYRTGMNVRRIYPQGDYLHLEIAGEKTIRARRVLLATGAVPRTLNIPGEHLAESGSVRKQLERFRGKTVVIVGGGDESAEVAVRLAENGAEVILLVRSRLKARRQFRSPLLSTPGIEIKTGEEAASLKGDEHLTGVTLISGKFIPADFCLIRIGMEAQMPQVEPPLKRSPGGRVKVDEVGRTSLKSIFAAGDLVEAPERRYISAAIGKGTIVGRTVESDLERVG